LVERGGENQHIGCTDRHHRNLSRDRRTAFVWRVRPREAAYVNQLGEKAQQKVGACASRLCVATVGRDAAQSAIAP
jgi:hypothetical protein